MASKPIPIEKRFWKKVIKSGSDGCWEWTGKRERNGYGRTGLTVDGIHRELPATHASWFIHFNQWPNKLVLHKCDNPPCVNPDHLFLGDTKTNVIDRQNKGRSKNLFGVGSRHHGAKLTESDVRKIRVSDKTIKELSEIFEVARSSISLIIARKTWKHI